MATATVAMPNIKRSEKALGSATGGVGAGASVCAVRWLRFPSFLGFSRFRANVAPSSKEFAYLNRVPCL